jgi:hypothetical protein
VGANSKLKLADLPKTQAEQRKVVAKWVSWRGAGDPRATGFWDVARAVLSLEVSSSVEAQRLLLGEVSASGRLLGGESPALARALEVYVRKGPLETARATVKALGALLETAATASAAASILVLLGRCELDSYADLVAAIAAVLGPPRIEAARTRASPPDAVAFGHPRFRGVTESPAERQKRLGSTTLRALTKVVEALRGRGVDVSLLDARLPVFESPPAREALETLAAKVAAKGVRFQLELPSGELSMHAATDSDVVAGRRFSKRGRLHGRHLGQVVLLTQGRAVKWSKPKSATPTGLYVGDAAWLRDVYEDFGGHAAQALVTGAFREHALVSSKKLGSATKGPDVLVVTDAQDVAAWSWGTDVNGAVVAVLIHARGGFTGWI